VTDLRDAMRAAVGAGIETVYVPEWERKVGIRSLSVKDQLDLLDDEPKPEIATMRILLAAMVDENGDRLLQDEDLPLLLDQPFPVLMPLLHASAKVNGLSTTELEAAMAAFARARGERPSTESPSPSGGPSQNSKPSPVSS